VNRNAVVPHLHGICQKLICRGTRKHTRTALALFGHEPARLRELGERFRTTWGLRHTLGQGPEEISSPCCNPGQPMMCAAPKLTLFTDLTSPAHYMLLKAQLVYASLLPGAPRSDS